ncbi:Panacea domain-containing protein [Methanolapillus millepedarum]|uniref:Antitoxin SocA-like Panacea domain-containing protein n=1 Tax=Methanolapillus millepedarum TaxID=3028296 RepID=A0AA96VEI9_9EURY|nr:hypothetical protein MsAc7_07140 [Methanosarcinaceae archaeon Ac7]
MTNSNQINYDIKDVADWFLSKEPMTHKKLQKLCYYAVAWYYALSDDYLCSNCTFQSWVHGPVNPIIYEIYRDYEWCEITSSKLKPDFGKVEEFLEMIWDTYGHFTGTQLEILTHEEDPWKNARGNLGTFDHSEAVISFEDMRCYYKKVYHRGQND